MRTVHRKHPDRQRVFPAAECARCGGELYGGDVCWRLNGRTLCAECVSPWLLEQLSGCRTRLGEVDR